MKIEEFKALANGAKVVWTGYNGPVDGVFTKNGDGYQITWSDGKVAYGVFRQGGFMEDKWVANIAVAATQFAEIKIPIPAGWVATGEFRLPSPLVDCYLHQDGVTVIEAKCGNQPCLGPRVILKRIVPKTLADRIRDYTRVIGEAVDATNPADEGALRIVILREVRRDLIEILKEFDGPESKA
jgi:hypothetical protein